MEDFCTTLKLFFKKAHISQKDITERLGISLTMVSYYLNGQREFGGNVAMKWGQTFGLDPLWLMTRGESGTPPSEKPSIAATAITTPTSTIEVPVLNLDSRGGLLPNNEADVMEYAIDTMPFNQSIAKAGDVVVPVYGDSMAPKYPAGSFILIRPIEAWREYIELGKAYVLELADWRRVIKIVRKGSDSTHYLLDSYNIDYESAEIAKSFINHVWQVVASVNRETM